MSDFFAHDPRIDEGTALRDLEKKVHYLMQMLSDAGLLNSRYNNAITLPDDINATDVSSDAAEVKNQLIL
jgi:hypothetical protein